MKIKKTGHKKLIFLFGLLWCLLPAVLLFCGFYLVPQYDDTYLGEMKYKLKRLEETSGKRIVILGGSNVPFSIKSELIMAHFPDYEVVDLGLYANLGTVIMLDFAKINVEEGDIYLIMPEQHEQTLSSYFSGEALWQTLDGAWGYLTFIDPSRKEELFAAFPIFAGKKLFYTVHGAVSADGIYARSSFNEYGDIAYQGRDYNVMDQGYNPNDLISFSPSMLTEELLNEMNSFASYVTEKGATVYYHFPAMNQLALTKNTTKASIDSYYDNLSEKLDFPILGNPHSSILDSDWFYDTNYHLNDSGAILYTGLMIEDLKVLFGDTSKVALPAVLLPTVPAEAEDSFSTYHNQDIDCFLYEDTAQGVKIVGLTDKGKAAKDLIVPGLYESRPVVAISETLFVGHSFLHSLTIQPNIGTLYDGAFVNCPNLEALILTGGPSDYHIGEDLMKGENFLIYVPASQLNRYKRDYSWQIYDGYLTSYEEEKEAYSIP